MLRGYFHSGLNVTDNDGEIEYNFVQGSIAPILMYKQSDKLFFEAEFEGQYEEGEFEWGIEYADMSFVLNRYITIRAGKFLLPFGSFVEKLHPAWINRLATLPLGLGHNGIGPTSDVGLELRGAFYIGSVKLNYQGYIVNGPQLNDGSDESEEAGELKFGYFDDNNSNKALGGRLGIFPFSNSMMEIGFSALTGKVGEEGTVYEDIAANLYAVDFSMVKNLNFLRSVIDIKGQYNYSKVDNANYPEPDTVGVNYTFINKSEAFFVQFSLRPSLLENDFLRSLELVGRYSQMKTPEGSFWEQTPDQLAIGLNYWIDWRTVLKIGYQVSNDIVMHEMPSPVEKQKIFYVHWAMGF